MSEQRIERPKRSVRPPTAARKPNLLDEWDVVRAAQHMLEVHGKEAFLTAEQRAEAANDIQFEKRWRAIAAAIRKIEDRS